MQAAAPRLMGDFAGIKAMFPSAKLTYISIPNGPEYGSPAKPGHQITDELVREVECEELKRNPPPVVLEAKRKFVIAAASRKRK